MSFGGMIAKLKRTATDARDAVRGEHVDQTGRVRQWRGLSLEEQNRRNTEQLNRFVVTWEDLVASPTSIGDERKRPLIYTHIPKAGGTTLEHLISKNYVAARLLHINAPALHRNPNAAFKKGRARDVIMGHHKLNHVVYQFMRQPFVHITVLRHPVSRVVSYYNYLQTTPNHHLHKQATELPIETFIEATNMVELQNGQTLRLAGLLERRIIKNRPNAPRWLERAKETLERRFSFFGVTEDYTRFLLLCRRLLGWEDIFYEQRNVSTKFVRLEELPASVTDRIRERNPLDLELHEFATRLFTQRCEALGIGQSDVARYKEHNARYLELLRATL